MADFNPCGNFEARLLVDGHLTKEPTEIDHSGVVSLWNFRLPLFTAEPNYFQLWGADDENAYLQALTKEKLCIVACPEVEERQEHLFAMYKAPYGTSSGGVCWHDRPLDILQPMGFLQLPVFWKGGTSEVTAKTRGSDTIFTITLGLLQSLMVQEGTPNLNVTLNSLPKKFWGLLDKAIHKTQQFTQFHPKRGGLSSTLMVQGQTYNLKCNYKWLPNKTVQFGWAGSGQRECTQ